VHSTKAKLVNVTISACRCKIQSMEKALPLAIALFKSEKTNYHNYYLSEFVPRKKKYRKREEFVGIPNFETSFFPSLPPSLFCSEVQDISRFVIHQGHPWSNVMLFVF